MCSSRFRLSRELVQKTVHCCAAEISRCWIPNAWSAGKQWPFSKDCVKLMPPHAASLVARRTELHDCHHIVRLQIARRSVFQALFA